MVPWLSPSLTLGRAHAPLVPGTSFEFWLCREACARVADIGAPESSRGMAKRGRGAAGHDADTPASEDDADTPASEDVLKAACKLLCNVYVSVGVGDVPSCDQLKHHTLWVRSHPAARVALLATRTRRDSTRCAFCSCAPAGGGPQDPPRTLQHRGCGHAARRVDEGVASAWRMRGPARRLVHCLRASSRMRAGASRTDDV